MWGVEVTLDTVSLKGLTVLPSACTMGNIFKALLVQPGENASLIRMRSLVQIQEGAPVPSLRGVDGTVTVPC